MNAKEVYSTQVLISRAEYEEKYKNNSKVFSQKELSYLKNRSAMTGAGFIATKCALIKLCSTVDNITLKESDIELGHNSDGAPIIESLPSDIHTENYKISISHSKNEIVGLASRGENS